VPSNIREKRHSAYYGAPIRTFLSGHSDQVLGTISAAQTFDLELEQRRAWQQEIEILKESLQGIEGTIFFEFDVPRLGSRIDAVIVSGPAIFPLEFKCGERAFHSADYNQAWDYALDLKNFHLESHHAPIFPVLVATEAPQRTTNGKLRISMVCILPCVAVHAIFVKR